MRNDLENERVRRHTSPSILARIDAQTDANIRFFSTQPPAEISARLRQHAVQGWCPPLPLFRQLGIRTRGEIDRELYALKALRGDFPTASPVGPVEAVQERADAVLRAVNQT